MLALANERIYSFGVLRNYSPPSDLQPNSSAFF
jgi:hypothetical protein